MAESQIGGKNQSYVSRSLRKNSSMESHYVVDWFQVEIIR